MHIYRQVFNILSLRDEDETKQMIRMSMSFKLKKKKISSAFGRGTEKLGEGENQKRSGEGESVNEMRTPEVRSKYGFKKNRFKLPNNTRHIHSGKLYENEKTITTIIIVKGN